MRPPLAGRRLERSEGERGTSHDRSHRTERVDQATVDVLTLMGRMVPYTRPQGGKRLRYDGVQAAKTFAQGKGRRQAALAKGEGVVKGAVPIIARRPSRQR